MISSACTRDVPTEAPVNGLSARFVSAPAPSLHCLCKRNKVHGQHDVTTAESALSAFKFRSEEVALIKGRGRYSLKIPDHFQRYLPLLSVYLKTMELERINRRANAADVTSYGPGICYWQFHSLFAH